MNAYTPDTGSEILFFLGIFFGSKFMTFIVNSLVSLEEKNFCIGLVEQKLEESRVNESW